MLAMVSHTAVGIHLGLPRALNVLCCLREHTLISSQPRVVGRSILKGSGIPDHHRKMRLPVMKAQSVQTSQLEPASVCNTEVVPLSDLRGLLEQAIGLFGYNEQEVDVIVEVLIKKSPDRPGTPHAESVVAAARAASLVGRSHCDVSGLHSGDHVVPAPRQLPRSHQDSQWGICTSSRRRPCRCCPRLPWDCKH